MTSYIRGDGVDGEVVNELHELASSPSLARRDQSTRNRQGGKRVLHLVDEIKITCLNCCSLWEPWEDHSHLKEVQRAVFRDSLREKCVYLTVNTNSFFVVGLRLVTNLFH
ncbi:hypothetical protein QVD17_28675 [Tagetes erecta]|uniref:Uncharacterized protein n=1 Tax=Tagetes erecta TaxID=13708 RepID=A0AAD8KBB5_TARER|nr:hypothetical protein QVD17_28675 [Tagetes erecta]